MDMSLSKLWELVMDRVHGQNKWCLWMGSLDSSARLDIQYGFSAPMFDISAETI